jgi:hypothetical protein
MAALLQKARRTAILRRARAGLALGRARDEEADGDGTPPPVSVVFAAPESAAGPRLPARPHPLPPATGWRRFWLGLGGVALVAGGALGLHGAPRAEAQAGDGTPAPELPLDPPRPLPSAPPPPADPPPVVLPAPVPLGPRADAHVNREGYGHIPGGVVFVPSTFSSEDGAYDLYLHFHGNTRVVRESAEHAGLNAIVAVVNLGVNSAPYLDGYEEPGTYERTLGAVGRVLGERGLDHAHLRRVAVGSWSGGYGAVSRILEHDEGTGALDAVIVLDGIHCGYLEEDPKALNVRIISPFLTGARRAAVGDFLFTVTHSEIDPGTYAGTAVTAGYLLDAVHARREAPGPAPEHLALRAAEGAVAKRMEKKMDPTYEATVGTFHVRGYRGNTPEHHMAHLLQMGATVMPELAERWRAR